MVASEARKAFDTRERALNKEQTWALIRGALRSTAASFPGLASLAQAWSEYETRLQAERVGLLLNEFSHRAKLNEERLKAVEDHIRESGEFSQLIEESVERSSREANERKIPRYAHLLVNLLAAGRDLTLDQKLSAIDDLDSLTLSDIEILACFDRSGEMEVHEWTRDGEGYDQRLGRIVSSLAKLQARGLIAYVGSVARADYVPQDWRGAVEPQKYELLPSGERLRQLLGIEAHDATIRMSILWPDGYTG